jgi:hypothetical protein
LVQKTNVKKQKTDKSVNNLTKKRTKEGTQAEGLREEWGNSGWEKTT